MANVLDYIPGVYHAAIADGSINIDLAEYLADAFAAASNATVTFPVGTYTLTTFALPANSTLLTDGPGTVFKQLGSAASIDPVLLIRNASNVTVESCTIVGIIASWEIDGSEFNHGIAIEARNGETARNIRIGDITARNIRGDGVYIINWLGGLVAGITIGDVFGDNVLRNIVGIVGGRDIDIGNIDGTAAGYSTLDLEPEGSYSEGVDGVTVRSVRGNLCQVAANPDTFVRNVRIDRLDTDPGYTADSTPPYERNALSPVSLHRTDAGLALRNAERVWIGHHRARGHTHHAVMFVPDAPSPAPFVTDPTIEIGSVDYTSIGAADSTYYTLIKALGMRQVVVRGGVYTVLSDAQSLIHGSSSSPWTECLVEQVRGNGLVAKWINRGRFTGVAVNAPSSRGAFQNLSNCLVANARIAAGYLGYNVADSFVELTDFDMVAGGSYVLGGASPGVRFRKSGIDGAFVEDGMIGSEALPNIGWNAAMGTANKGSYAVYAGQNVGSSYSQVEAQETDDAVKAVAQRVKAIEDAARALGDLRG
ncbi:hypothetical protein DAH66_09150 [Sphingomonas koreensis]|uniref:Pectate lyase superfamily protein domain-containing protein n=1 Tax=Sphingomonas koreensis TaxID=93064 RepID=A0A430G4Z7_9SPHN|nr:hypothetical protein [Sphingomonas koreensis]RSY87010.1 hypothetical protein DAH66_09150 [Sphingomonas koreensis]